MSDADARKNTVLKIASSQLGAPPQNLESPFTVLASPAWRGVEADIWVAQWGDATRVYKHYHPDTAFYVDAVNAMQIARQVGDLGVAPTVEKTWDESALMEMRHVGISWRAGGLHDAADSVIRLRVVAAKKTIQGGPRFARDADIFGEIRALHAFCIAHRVKLPQFIDAYLGFAQHAEHAIRAVGVDKVPCHRDGNTSNLMIGPNQEVLLLDFDLAANADPYEDVGCYLIEMFEREPEARAGFEEWHGSFSESLFQRAMTYGFLDDLRWGLIASGMAATSPRKTLEFAKYASWRYLRFDQNSQRSHAADRLRKLGK
ncbi:MAG: aminoglycoside phosphotransferase family protein [Pusillimonas sp.]|nr:MAG: aminoglycoside phosphotransferase family protein [Pusillimonas sp.]